MAKAKQTDFVTLRDSADANKLGIKLLRDESGQLAYGWQLLPEQVWTQNNWWNGGLQFYYEPRLASMYGINDGMWPATQNELSMGPKVEPTPLAVRNGGAERGDTNIWTATGCALASESTASNVHSGRYAFKVSGFDTNDTVLQTVSNPTRFQGIAARFSCWARIASGSTCTARLNIVESGGASTPTTNGAAVVLTTTYQRLTVNVTIQADSTGVSVQLESTSSTTATIFFDECSYDDAADSTKQIQNPFFEIGSDLGLVTRRGVWRWDESNDYWAIQKFHATDITGHRVWDDRVFVALGAGTPYQYSDAGDPTTWTESNAADDEAQFFAVGRTAFANTMGMYKTLDPDSLKTTVDPVNSGTAWGAAIEVGTNDRSITGIYENFGQVYVAKEDGLYAYATLDFASNIQGMTNVSQGLEFTAGDTNFSRGDYHNGWFYTVIGELGFVRYNQSKWELLSDVIASPAFTEFGGKVSAIGSDGQRLYLMIEDRATAATSKEAWLFLLKDHPQGWELHPLKKILMNKAYGFGAQNNNTSNFTFVAGDIHTQFVVYRVWWGQKANTPRHALNNALSVAGAFTTSYLDMGQKMTMNRLVLISEDLDSNLTVTAAYEVDAETSFTNINSTDATFNTSPAETIAFNPSVSGRRIRLRFTGASNSESAGPVIKGFELHLDRLKEWRLVGVLTDNAVGLQGIPGGMTSTTMISYLTTLRKSVAQTPLKFEDIDGTTQRVVITDMQEVQFRVSEMRGAQPQFARGLSLTLREAVA